MSGGPLRDDTPVTPPPIIKPEAIPVRIPVSFWVWLVILIACYALPNLLAVQGRGAKVVQESGLTAAGLQQLQGAEVQIRLGLSEGTIWSAARQREDPLAVAAASYRNIALNKKGVVSARKVIVLDHLLKKPLDESFLTGVLAKNLAEHKADPGAIAGELALWRSLYGKDAAAMFDKDTVDDTVTRIKKLNLGTLEGRVVADAYAQAGRSADAQRERQAVSAKASDYLGRMAIGVLVIGMAALIGFVLLIVAIIAVAVRRWDWIGRVHVPTFHPEYDRPVSPNFGSLLDIFVAYLAISRGMGLLAGSLSVFDALPAVALTAGVYVGSAAAAAVYLWYRARIEGWKLADIGLRAPGGLVQDVLYGLAGYCAALPLIFTFGAINARYFKREDSSLAPNPVLPMIAGEGSEIGRFVLFCLVAVAAPIFEELFFRGVLYSALKTRFNTAASIIISGACFAIVHPMGDWLPIFVLGCALASVRELRGGLVPGMVMHFCQNSMAFIAMRMLFN